MKEFLASLYYQLTSASLANLLKRRKKNNVHYQPTGNRLLYVPASSLPYHVSGYTTRTHEVIRALVDAGGDIAVLTRPGYPWDRGDRVQHTVESITVIDNITYCHLPSPSKHRPLLLYALQAARVIKKIALQQQVRIIHAASNHENAIPALLAAKELAIPFQYEMRGLWELTRASRIPGYENSADFLKGLALEGFVANQADRVLVISEQLRKFAQERWNIPADRFSLLPNCVNPAHFLPADPGTVETNTIGYAGSLLAYEGLDTLIEATYQLINRGINIQVNIVGDGEARGELQQQVQQLGLSDHVHILGRVSPTSAREIISRCTLICIPRKPFKVCQIVPPIKLVEALATGKPVIVPDLPVFRDEMGANPAGWFFKAGEATDLAQVIETALANQTLLTAYSIRAREYAATQRRWSDFVGNVLPTTPPKDFHGR